MIDSTTEVRTPYSPQLVDAEAFGVDLLCFSCTIGEGRLANSVIIEQAQHCSCKAVPHVFSDSFLICRLDNLDLPYTPRTYNAF